MKTDNVIYTFIEILVDKLKASNYAYANLSDFPSFISEHEHGSWKSLSRDELHIEVNARFEFIVADLPIGMPKIRRVENDSSSGYRQNWTYIYQLLNLLSSDGVAAVLIEPIGFSSRDGDLFLTALKEIGCHLLGYVECPAAYASNITTIRPIIAIIGKNPSKHLFLASLTDVDKAKQIAKNFVSEINTSDLLTGIASDANSFRSFQSTRNSLEISKLETQFKQFKQYNLKEITTEIVSVKSGKLHTQSANAVYIPKLGKSDVISDLSLSRLKHHNYYKIILTDIALSAYVATFFNSSIGRLLRESSLIGAIIPQLRKSDVGEIIVALPSIEEQKEISSTHIKLGSLRKAITEIEKEISVNPITSKILQTKIDGMLDTVGALSVVDRVKAIVRVGESKNIEFKETFSMCVKEKKKKPFIEESALKTIVAFLNTEGGTLLVGVRDDQSIVGVAGEMKQFFKDDRDTYLLHIKNKIRSSIGEENYPYVEYDLYDIGGNPVLVVDCKQANAPCYLNGEKFFVRRNPATDLLEGPKLVKYVQNHFNL